MRYPRARGRGVLEAGTPKVEDTSKWKNSTGRELTGLVHLRDEKFGGRVHQWSEKEVRGMSQRA